MKRKRKLKRWVKNLLVISVIYLIGIGCFLLLCERAEQVDRWEANQNERINY